MLAIIGVIISTSCLPVAHTFSFKLSRILFDDSAADDADLQTERLQRPVFPRRDLIQEFGQVQYQCLIEAALASDGGICLNGDLERSKRTVDVEGAKAGAMTKASSYPDAGYGVDVSFPIQHPTTTGNSRRDFYQDFIEGCKNYYSSDPHACDQFERDRMDMNRNQPPVMQNYTTIGFQKTRAPPHLMKLLIDFFENNEMGDSVEKWYPGDTHTNHWKSKSYMMNVQDETLQGGGMSLTNSIWSAVHDILVRWIKTENPNFHHKLSPASLYGIRTYTKGAVLAPHVDRLPLVTSAVINVAQDLDGGEAWPLEVYAHDGMAYNVTLEPGDMLLYESHSIIHGRPFPFEGKYYSNVFIHFEPEGHCVRHSDRMHGYEIQDDVEERFRRAKRRQAALAAEKSQGRSSLSENHEAHEHSVTFAASELPFFIQPGSYEAKRWKQLVTFDRNINELRRAPAPNIANVFASKGDLSKLKELARNDPDVLSKPDVNGWQPIHEAARSGNTEVIKFLIENGVDVNARTNGGRGASPLWWVEDQHGFDHEAAKILRKAGAVSLAPKV